MTIITAIVAIKEAINDTNILYNQQNILTHNSIPLEEVEAYERKLSGLKETLSILEKYTGQMKGEDNV